MEGAEPSSNSAMEFSDIYSGLRHGSRLQPALCLWCEAAACSWQAACTRADQAL